MKRLAMLCALLLLCPSPAWPLGAGTAASSITAVTLYLNRALITREAQVSVGKGINEVLLDIQAFQVDKESVTAKVYGEGAILGVRLKEIFLKDFPQERIVELESRIEELERRKQMLNDQKLSLDKQEEFLDALVLFSKTHLPEAMQTKFPSIEELSRTLAFLGEGLGRIHGERRAVTVSAGDVDKDLLVLGKELESLRGMAHEAGARAIEIVFDSAREQTLNIEARYAVENASWEPLYRAGVDLEPGEMVLTMSSRISQTTGEDWRDVSLTLSNIVPVRGAGLPSIRSWWLDIPKEVSLEEGVNLERRPQRLMQKMDADNMMAPALAPAEPQEAQRRDTGLSFEYALPGRVSIESREKETLLPLFTKMLEGEFHWLAVPARNSLVYLVCTAKGDSELLAGTMNIHVGGHFVGSTTLEEKRPGEDFRLSVGPDRQVKVSRRKVVDRTKETYFGRIERETVVREVAYTILVENLKDKTVSLKVIDSLPVSRTDRIEVKDVRISPDPRVRDYENKEGVMLWEMGLAPGEKKEVNISFVVTYPKDMEEFEF